MDESTRAFLDRLQREVDRLTGIQRGLDETAIEIEHADQLLEEAIAVVTQFEDEAPEPFLETMRVLLKMRLLDERLDEKRQKIAYLLSRASGPGEPNA